MNSRGSRPLSAGRSRGVVRLDQLGTLIRERRANDGLTLEQAARQCGVGAATLWRLEQRTSQSAAGKSVPTPDVRTLSAITDWLGVSISGDGFSPSMTPETVLASSAVPVPDVVEAHLRADRNLDSGTAALLARMFRAAYTEAVENSEPSPDKTVEE